jgi:hypothetical protein
LEGVPEMAAVGALIAIFGFCAFFTVAPSVVEPARLPVLRNRPAAILWTLASLAIMAIGTHV